MSSRHSATSARSGAVACASPDSAHRRALTVSPVRYAISAASYQSSGSPSRKAGRSWASARSTSPDRASIRARWRRAAGRRSGQVTREERDQPLLGIGGLGDALRREQRGDLDLEGVDLGLGQV